MKYVGLRTALRLFGILNLLGGMIGGFYLIANAKTPLPGYAYLTETNPSMIIAGIALLVEGLIGCVLFYAVAAILEEVTFLADKVDIATKSDAPKINAT